MPYRDIIHQIGLFIHFAPLDFALTLLRGTYGIHIVEKVPDNLLIFKS